MINLVGLGKRFGQKDAVKGINLSVEKGQVLGLIGPNGAGKSTTMKMASGILRPDRGQALLCDVDIWKHPKKAKKVLGFLPESAPSYDEQTVSEFLGFMLNTRGIYGSRKKQLIGRAIELCFLEQVQHQLIGTLSKGYRHRICLAQSIMHDPEIIILDEPTDGLDPNQKSEVRKLIGEIKEDKAIIISTHILDEVRAACSQVALIDHGEIIFEGTPDEFRKSGKATGRLKIRVTELPPTLIETLSQHQQIDSVLRINEHEAYLNLHSSENEIGENHLKEELIRLSVAQSWGLQEISEIENDLESVFRQKTLNETASIL